MSEIIQYTQKVQTTFNLWLLSKSSINNFSK